MSAKKEKLEKQKTDNQKSLKTYAVKSLDKKKSSEKSLKPQMTMTFK